jgi:DNA-binding NarL/FixJ family response regulator
LRALAADKETMATEREKQDGYDEVVAALAAPPKPSARELELLTLMADGLTDAEIAEKLSISAKTMRSRLHALRLKMQARTRTHSVAIAFRRGLLEVERRDSNA